MHKLIVLDFGINTDHIISARWPDLLLIDKKKRDLVDFAVSVDHGVEVKENW